MKRLLVLGTNDLAGHLVLGDVAVRQFKISILELARQRAGTTGKRYINTFTSRAEFDALCDGTILFGDVARKSATSGPERHPESALIRGPIAPFFIPGPDRDFVFTGPGNDRLETNRNIEGGITGKRLEEPERAPGTRLRFLGAMGNEPFPIAIVFLECPARNELVGDAFKRYIPARDIQGNEQNLCLAGFDVNWDAFGDFFSSEHRADTRQSKVYVTTAHVFYRDHNGLHA